MGDFILMETLNKNKEEIEKMEKLKEKHSLTWVELLIKGYEVLR